MIQFPRVWVVSQPFVVAVLVLFSGSVRAAGREEAAVARLVQMNKRALGDYDNLEWKNAKRRLLEAIAEGKKSGIASHPIMARTYLHLGAVYIVGMKDREAGVQSFMHALQIDPNIHIATAMETPAMTAAFGDAHAKVTGGGGGTAASSGGDAAPEPPKKAAAAASDEDEPDLPLNVQALDCPNTDEVVRDKAFPVRCAVAASLKVGSVVLFYRMPGQEEFTSVEMKKSAKGWYTGEIPKNVTSGKAVQFYVEGRDRKGKAIVANGRTGSPNLMLVKEADGDEEEEVPPVADTKTADPEENPLEKKGEKRPRVVVSKSD